MAANPPVDPKWIRNPSDDLAIEQGCWFDEPAGQFVCDFMERFCCQSKGRWAGKPIVLLDWQRDVLMRLFGWKRPDGRRRFKRAYLEVAKKNGKSTLMSALVIVLLVADGEGGPEIYLNAVDRDQASIVFDEAAKMVAASPELHRRLEVVDSKKRILHPAGNGVIRANSADAAKQDGLNPSGIVFDELHRQKNRFLWDIFEHADASREQPLWVSITTAGDSEEGPWFDQRDYSEKVNNGAIPDITHLGVVYRALPDDDLDDPATWRKANPSLGVTIDPDDFGRKLADAKRDPAKLALFKRLRLNIITRGDTQFVTLEDWDRGRVPIIRAGRTEWYAGLDLSESQDLTALAFLSADGRGGIDVEMRFFLPSDNIVQLEQQHGVPYRAWADRGLIILTEGNVVDYSYVRREINELAADLALKKLLVDPYNATKLAIELREQDGLPVELIRQGFLSLSAPTKALKRLVLSGRIRHGGHPVLRWHASNAVVITDSAGNLKLCKKKSRKKIDGMAALVNAIAAMDGDETSGSSVYESRGLLFL